jgi:hypothetical protein
MAFENNRRKSSELNIMNKEKKLDLFCRQFDIIIDKISSCSDKASVSPMGGTDSLGTGPPGTGTEVRGGIGALIKQESQPNQSIHQKRPMTVCSHNSGLDGSMNILNKELSVRSQHLIRAEEEEEQAKRVYEDSVKCRQRAAKGLDVLEGVVESMGQQKTLLLRIIRHRIEAERYNALTAKGRVELYKKIDKYISVMKKELAIGDTSKQLFLMSKGYLEVLQHTVKAAISDSKLQLEHSKPQSGLNILNVDTNIVNVLPVIKIENGINSTVETETDSTENTSGVNTGIGTISPVETTSAIGIIYFTFFVATCFELIYCFPFLCFFPASPYGREARFIAPMV